MNKTKRALISMIVVSAVFCLTQFLSIKLPIFSEQGNNSNLEEVVSTEATSLVNETQQDSIQSLSLNNEQTGAFHVEDNLTVAEVTETPVEPIINQDSALAIEADPTEQASTNGNELSEDQTQSSAKTDESKDSNISTKENSTTDQAAEADAKDTVKDTKNEDATETVSEDSSTKKDNTKEKKPEPKYANVGISVAKDYVNIRKEPTTNAEVLGKLYRNSGAYILEKKDGWYYVESGSVTGYIKEEFIKTGIPDDELIEKYGTLTAIVDVDGLNVREETTTESKKLTVVYMNEKYPVIEVMGEWVKINIEDDNIKGYVKTEFLDIDVTFKDAVSKEEEQKLLQLQAEERAKKETAIKYGDGFTYTNEDIRLLACLVHAEAGGQSYEGKLAVANVVLNRVKSSRYPDSIKSVIYQSGQFSVAKSGSLQKQLDKYSSYTSKAQLLSIKAAKEALAGANNIGTRLYFHTIKAAARKGYTNKSTSVKIGDHLFW